MELKDIKKLKKAELIDLVEKTLRDKRKVEAGKKILEDALDSVGERTSSLIDRLYSKDSTIRNMMIISGIEALAIIYLLFFA